MKPIAEQDLYELLEVERDAPQAAIAVACNRMEAVCAPDSLAAYTLMSSEDSALLGVRLAEARAVLLDPASRREYDERLRSPVVAPAMAVSDLLPPPLARPHRRVADAGRPEQLRLAVAMPDGAPETEVEPASPPPREPAPGAEVASPAPADDRSAANEAWAAPAQAPILLSREVPLAPPIPLATQAHVSPPFAAVADAAAPPRPPPAAAEAGAEAGAREAPRADPRPTPPPRPVSTELFVPEGTRYTGEVLRRAREARGLTVQQVCDRTKILRQHVENLEGDSYDRLPVTVYLRGILMALSKELRLDGQKVARSYLEAMAEAREGSSR